jgi:hypothetical protein
MENITIERLEQIERERLETMANKKFQQWMKKLNISQSYSEPTGRLNARDMNNQYDYKNFNMLVR